ncbi:MAG: hypothetical protein VYD68_02145 [Pseudomonadota bacterium]|nr:hypothetical protein [Pseudomonadota bacterium]
MLLPLIMGVVSCAAPQHNFASITEAELLAYNAGRPVLAQIFCQKMKPTSSRIRRNVCRSVEDWVHHNERTLPTIGAMNSGDYSVFGSTRD